MWNCYKMIFSNFTEPTKVHHYKKGQPILEHGCVSLSINVNVKCSSLSFSPPLLSFTIYNRGVVVLVTVSHRQLKKDSHRYGWLYLPLNNLITLQNNACLSLSLWIEADALLSKKSWNKSTLCGLPSVAMLRYVLFRKCWLPIMLHFNHFFAKYHFWRDATQCNGKN